MNIYDFADAIEKNIVIIRYNNQDNRFLAMFERCEVSEGFVLIGEYGTGTNPIQAVNDYAKKLQGRKIVFDAYSDNRIEYDVPKNICSVTIL